MTEHIIRFDAESVRESWNRAAASFDRAPDLEDAARVPYYVFFDLIKPA